jgi:carbamate kinase
MTDKQLAVVAIGGNSLIRDEKRVSVEDQEDALRETARHLADMVEAGWDLAIGHGNGPQVGFILRRSEIAAKAEGMHEVPLDVCGADSQGAIGYELQQALQNEYHSRGIAKGVCTVITQVAVDAADPAFEQPTKPIGSFMLEEEARRREREMRWSVVEDAGRGWRRVVASPLPKKIVELEAVRLLLDSGQTVITVGGGGIPVVEEGGTYTGTAAVIDKDFASALLAREIGAGLFLIATAVEKVAINYCEPDEKWLARMTLGEARQYLAEGKHFAKGSMAPKIQAVISFLDATPTGRALITNPQNIGRALRGETGTWIVHD